MSPCHCSRLHLPIVMGEKGVNTKNHDVTLSLLKASSTKEIVMGEGVNTKYHDVTLSLLKASSTKKIVMGEKGVNTKYHDVTLSLLKASSTKEIVMGQKGVNTKYHGVTLSLLKASSTNYTMPSLCFRTAVFTPSLCLPNLLSIQLFNCRNITPENKHLQVTCT